MKLNTGRILTGPAGTATEVLIVGVPDRPDWKATLGTWFLDCPGQSPAWSNYGLSIIHLRDIPDVPPADIRVPKATHEVILTAFDPEWAPEPLRSETWRMLFPVNVMEQVELPSDEKATELVALCAAAVVKGVLPAEPPLAGAVEPWRTALIKSSAHLRGEEHAS